MQRMPVTQREYMEERVRDGFAGQRMTVLPPDIRRRSRSLPVVQDLYVTDIGHFPSAPHHYVDRPDGTEEAILIYCITGLGWCRMGEKRWTVREGWALLIPPGTPHVYGSDPEAPWSIFWSHFGGTRVRGYLEMLGVTGQEPVFYAPEAQVIVQLFEEAYSHVYHGYTDTSLIGLSTVMTHLLGLLKCHQRAPNAVGRHREENILKSIQYMREHLHEPHTLVDLAQTSALSVSHYSRLFREQTNTSPLNFFIRLKMQRACALLDTTDNAVGDIAQKVGYDDPFHFCRMFKKVIGMPPTSYRDKVKG